MLTINDLERKHETDNDSFLQCWLQGHTKSITCFSDRPCRNSDPGGGELHQGHLST